MKKLLYTAIVDFDDRSSGVVKKIRSQCTALTKIGYDVYLYGCKGNIFFLEHFSDNNKELSHIEYKGKRLFCFWKCLKKEIIHENLKVDYLYVRYSLVDFLFCSFLRFIHKRGTKTVMEIPTYLPKDKIKHSKVDFLKKFEFFFQKACKETIENIFYIGDKVETIYGCGAIQIPNGYPEELLFLQPSFDYNSDGTVNLIGVSIMGENHGYDRLIQGMYNYITAGGSMNFRILLVGEGDCKEKYVNLTKTLGLSNLISFSGSLYGEDLNNAFKTATIGIGSLGCYRNGQNETSTLKIKEYMMRGLPFIFSGSEIGIPSNYKYCIQFENNSSPIDFFRIEDFCTKLKKFDRSRTIIEIRDFVINNFSWKDIFVKHLISIFPL